MEEGAKVMGTWVSALPFKVPFDLEELKANLVSPTGEVEEKDELVGEFTEDERLAWTLMERLNEAAERARVDFTYARSDEQKTAAEMEFHINKEKGQLVRNIFWAMIRENHDLWMAEHLSVRGGFKIVKSESAVGSLLEAIISHAGHRR